MKLCTIGESILRCKPHIPCAPVLNGTSTVLCRLPAPSLLQQPRAFDCPSLTLTYKLTNPAGVSQETAVPHETRPHHGNLLGFDLKQVRRKGLDGNWRELLGGIMASAHPMPAL